MPTTTRRVLNVPLLIATVVLIAILVPSLYFLHGFQVGRSAGTFLVRADTLEGESDFKGAARSLHRYLKLNPDEVEVQIRLAKLYEKSAESPREKSRAIDLFYESVGVAPQDEQPELLRALSQLLLDVGRFAESETMAQKLVDADPSHSEGARLVAEALYGQVQSGALHANRREVIAAACERAWELNPGHIRLAVIVSEVYRNHENLLDRERQKLTDEERHARADRVMDQMIAAHPEAPEAYLARFRYRLAHELPGAEQDVESALQYGPDELEVRLAAASYALDRARRANPANVLDTLEELSDSAGDSEDALFDLPENAEGASESGRTEPAAAVAETYLRKAQGHFEYVLEKIDPANEAAYVGLGDVFAFEGKAEQAIATWKAALKEVDERSIQLNARLSEHLTNRGELEEAEHYLDTLEREAARIAPRLVRVSELHLLRMQEFLRARWHLRKGQPASAIPLLESVASARLSAETADQRLQSRLMLAAAYATTGQWDRAAINFHTASQSLPSAASLKVLTARAWFRAGQIESAVSQLQQALSIASSPRLWFSLAEMRLVQQKRLPPAEQDWSDFEVAFQKAKEAGANQRDTVEPWRMAWLEADYAIVRAEKQGDLQAGMSQALEILEQAEQKYPEAANLIARIAQLHQQLDQTQEASDALTRLSLATDQQLGLHLAHAAVLVEAGDYEEARRVLQNGLEELDDDTRTQLTDALIRVEIKAGRLDEASRLLEQLHTQSPEDVTVLTRLAEIAVQTGDYGKLETWEKRLRHLEGPAGTYWRYFRILRIALQNGDLDDADRLHDQLKSQRPSWPQTFLLDGLISERRGNIDSAVASYQRAIQLGGANVFAYERLTALLHQQQRFAEAEEYLSHLKRVGGTTIRSDMLESSLATSQGDLSRAVAAARRRVDGDPDDPVAQLWLGRVLLLADQPDAARVAFEQATQLAPQDPRAWNGLFTFYVETENDSAARETLEKMTRSTRLSASENAFVLAQGYQVLDDRKQAEQYYQEAIRLAPDNPAILASMVDFYMPHDPEMGTQVLERLVKVAPEADQPRRLLATILAARGDDEDFQRALELLRGDAQQVDGGQPLNRKLQAVLLAFRTGDHRENIRQARQIMAELVGNAPVPSDGDRLLLARLYLTESLFDGIADLERRKRIRAARKQYEALVNRSDAKSKHVADFIDFLLRYGSREEMARQADKLVEMAVLSEMTPSTYAGYVEFLTARDFDEHAARMLERLESQLPDQSPDRQAVAVAQYVRLRLDRGEVDGLDRWLQHLETSHPHEFATLNLRARWMQKQGQDDGIEALIESFAEKRLAEARTNEQRAEIHIEVVNVYVELDRLENAKKWARQLLSVQMDRYDVLANVYRMQNRVSDAVRICTEAAKVQPGPQAAVVLASILIHSQPEPSDYTLAEPVLKSAVASYSDSVPVLTAVANVRIKQDRIQEAIRLYKKLRELEPKNAVVLNNLASLLSESDQDQAAIECIEQAIQMAGIAPVFLDTMGMIYVRQGRPDAAIEALRIAAEAPDADPRFSFHLAIALQDAGQTEQARAAFKRSLNDKLTSKVLMPSDQTYLARLQQELQLSN